ncbi:MAG: hypothetical protein Kow0010_07960 [Dehalococcoidia bacterium]
MSAQTEPWSRKGPPVAIALGYIRRIPRRLREREFWITQAFIASITVAHYSVERWFLADQTTTVHHIPVSLYLIAVVYAGLHYGLEGGLLTAGEAVLLSLPSVAWEHRENYMYLGELAALLATMGSGAVVAWLVEREGRLRKVAEDTSQRLSSLHDLSAVVNRSLDLDRVLDGAVHCVSNALRTDRSWICVWDAPGAPPMLRWEYGAPIAIDPAEPEKSGTVPAWEVASAEVQRTDRLVALDGRALAVPLAVESETMGALGVACHEPRTFTDGDRELLAAMANQVAMAMRNARLFREEQQMRQAVRRYAGQVTRAQEDERKRIARELHDEVVQTLIVMCHELDAVIDGAPDCARHVGQLRRLREQAQAAAQSVRRFSRDLRPAMLDDLGLAPAIEWLVQELSGRGAIDATMTVRGEARRVSPDVELHLFRIAQEALHNVERHSGADHVQVALAFEPDRVTLCVRDDGCGLSPAGADTSRLGILGMNERARLVGGEIEIQSEPGQGVTVQVVVPL